MSKDKNLGKHLIERLANTIDVSKDVILDLFLIKAIGNSELCIENFKGILAYSDTAIKIKAVPRSIEVCGKSLELCNISDEILSISGEIETISFS